MKRRLFFRFTIHFALTLVISCTSVDSMRYRHYPANPYPEYRKIAILPFLNYTKETVDGEKIGEIFASQLTRFPGYNVVRPSLVETVRKKNKLVISSPDEAIQCARLLGADAVLVGVITEYNPYYPPRIGMAIQVFAAKRPFATAVDVERLMQSGKPFALSRCDAERTLVVLEEVFDGGSNLVRDRARAYGLVHGTAKDFNPEETFLRITNKFVEFISEEMIRRMISFCEMVKKKEEKKKAEKREEREPVQPTPAPAPPPCD